MTFFQGIASKHPELKRKLIIAHIDIAPEKYVERNVKLAVMFSMVITVTSVFFLLGMGKSLLLTIPIAGITYFLMFMLFMRSADVEIRKRAKEIDKDVLFAGRFLLIKLNSGRPLMNAIIDASNSYGVASGYFKEIVREIELGTPIEEALDKASRYSPSEKMQRILFQISNALKIGIDVTNFLEAILDEIAHDQLTEIQRYGKKLSGLTMFYMLFAVIIPSLGITMFITVVSLVSIQVDVALFIVVLFALVVIEFIFITIFKASRPTVNI
ncbi:MAG: type II secretion system F family protein [Candidatus Woesearchaeota archaeon]|nr:type II secretion system F family protein [Candidatus Woesearchaeota archaeon]